MLKPDSLCKLSRSWLQAAEEADNVELKLQLAAHATYLANSGGMHGHFGFFAYARGERSMTRYRFFELGRFGEIVGSTELACRSEGEIRTTAERLLRDANGRINGVEVWFEARRILKVPGGESPRSDRIDALP